MKEKEVGSGERARGGGGKLSVLWDRESRLEYQLRSTCADLIISSKRTAAVQIRSQPSLQSPLSAEHVGECQRGCAHCGEYGKGEGGVKHTRTHARSHTCLLLTPLPVREEPETKK